MKDRPTLSASKVILPLLLVLFGPLDLIIGLLHGNYPTEATIISLTSFIIGFILFRYNRSRLNIEESFVSLTSETYSDRVISENAPETENEVLAAATARLNTRLGTGLLIFGMGFNLLFIINGLVGSQRASDSSAGNLIETGFVVFFNLMVAGLEAFAARIYTAGRR